MLAGSVAGGLIAQHDDLAVPFVVRGAILLVTFAVAFRLMRDIGFTPRRGGRPLAEMRAIASASIDYGWRVPAVKWLMVQALVTGGVGIYSFYALQPYLLELYGDPNAYQIAGLVAAIVAGAEILGGLAAPHVRRLFHRRTSALIAAAALSAITLAMMGVADSFAAVLGLTVGWGLLWAAATPIRQAYINSLIPSQQRATILSFDSLMASSGGVWAQPALGRAADVWGYGPSYLVAAGISAFALPFLSLSRRHETPADTAAPGGAAAQTRLTAYRPEASHSAGSGGGRTGRYGLPPRHMRTSRMAVLRGSLDAFCCRRQHRPTESRSAALCDAISDGGRFLMNRGKGRA